jgi:hypothetical protein
MIPEDLFGEHFHDSGVRLNSDVLNLIWLLRQQPKSCQEWRQMTKHLFYKFCDD